MTEGERKILEEVLRDITACRRGISPTGATLWLIENRIKTLLWQEEPQELKREEKCRLDGLVA